MRALGPGSVNGEFWTHGTFDFELPNISKETRLSKQARRREGEKAIRIEAERSLPHNGSKAFDWQPAIFL
jgi:hypothetical protein